MKVYVREEGFFKGVWKATKNKFQEASTLAQGAFAEDANAKPGELSNKQKYELNNSQLYNKFVLDASQRESKLNEKGVGQFETDLESVFNQVLLAYTKQDVSRKYVPVFNAMRASLVYASLQGGNNLKDVIEAFDKMVKSKFYGEPIMDTNLQPIYRILW